jgi:hypothetical protein
MRLEAIFAKTDLVNVAGKLCPLRLNIGEGGCIVICDPRDIELVPDVGLRMTV